HPVNNANNGAIKMILSLVMYCHPVALNTRHHNFSIFYCVIIQLLPVFLRQMKIRFSFYMLIIIPV
ncbi:hypothetical protein, partial [Escherichia coli]|uniref:hypothetical protein n=1 Tax=Escherichia coli TaxID=562 RepID=UPI001853CD5B